jgi:hypothetical protein
MPNTIKIVELPSNYSIESDFNFKSLNYLPDTIKKIGFGGSRIL